MVAVLVLMIGGVVALNATNPPGPTDPTVYVLDVKDADVQRLDVRTNAGTVAFDRNDREARRI
jgi:hypothetical protein